jgi:hypothetical protein
MSRLLVQPLSQAEHRASWNLIGHGFSKWKLWAGPVIFDCCRVCRSQPESRSRGCDGLTTIFSLAEFQTKLIVAAETTGFPFLEWGLRSKLLNQAGNTQVS